MVNSINLTKQYKCYVKLKLLVTHQSIATHSLRNADLTHLVEYYIIINTDL